MKPMRLSNFGSLKAQFRAKWFKPQMDRWSKKQKKKIKTVRLVLLTKSLSSFVVFFNKLMGLTTTSVAAPIIS
jgi:predicted alpha/beta hydrolase family esterase